jgi:hypothetical protein
LFFLPSLTADLEIATVNVLTASTSAIGLILLITDLFYIRHYYRLENGTAKLYIATNRLYALLAKKLKTP